MKVDFFSLDNQYQNIKQEISKEINKVLENQSFILGNKVEEFENKFAKMHNAKYCVALNSGTAALHTALSILGVKNTDEVLVPTNSFFSTAEAVSIAGAKPVLVDTDKDYFHIDLEDAKKKLTKKTKFIIPVHLYGNPVNMQKLRKFANEHNLQIIEDCAQAHLATFKDKFVGNFGKVGCFSFYPSKNLGAYGEGGAIITNNKSLYQKALMFRNHGSNKRYYHEFIGHNYRLNGIQGAVLNVKLKYIDQFTNKRIELANIYHQYITESEYLSLPKVRKDVKHVYHLFVIRHKNRNNLSSYLSKNLIGTSLHYPVPIHKQKAYKSNKYIKMTSENTANEILSLPMYPELSIDQVKYVSEKINNYNNVKY